MLPSVGEWGLYPWFEERGRSLVHPQDADAFSSLLPYGKLFQCVAWDNQYMTLRYGNRQFRVRPDLFAAVTAPPFDFGQTVAFGKGGRAVSGTVVDICWHHGRDRPFFHLRLNGKRLKKRYWAEDLVGP